MATYNRAHFIVETLRSIQKQTYENWECLIVDDGGSDNTLEVITPILEKDPRFLFFRRSDAYKKGLPGCRNFGIDKASGNFIIFFDDDDIVHPRNLELCISALRQGDYKFCRYERAVFYGDFHYTFDDQETFDSFEISNRDMDKMIDHRLPFNSCAVMWKNECFSEIRFNEMLMYAEEWECYSRILSEDIKGISIKKTLFYGRKHSESNTGEFQNKNPVRIKSKKEAIKLISANLADKQLLSPGLITYLTGLAMAYRDKKLLDEIIEIAQLETSSKLFITFKYYVYPLWVVYKRFLKKLKK
jgi:glycosyltransferase involved in cell wall biosynthesis